MNNTRANNCTRKWYFGITARANITAKFELYDKAGWLIEAIRKNLKEQRNGG
jgi:hypothetical protein